MTKRVVVALLIAVCFFNVTNSNAQQGATSVPKATLEKVRVTCLDRRCPKHDAIIFVHGIYGNRETFKYTSNSGSFDWPENLPRVVEGQTIDVYRLNYDAHKIAWREKNILKFDDVVDAVFDALQGPDPYESGPASRYRSIGFVAHSLGGNIVAAYLHSVKSELGHADRAKHSFLITLGTPVNGSNVANVGLVLKKILLMQDDLLESLRKDDVFLRMMTVWRRAETRKAARFRCRPVALHVAVEGAPLVGVTVEGNNYGIVIVTEDSADGPVRGIARGNVKKFENYNHEQIAKPQGESDELYTWVNGIISSEMKRLNDWDRSNRLCKIDQNEWRNYDR